MHDVPCQVAGSINIEYVDRVAEHFQHESQPFSNGFVDEGGVSSTV